MGKSNYGTQTNGMRKSQVIVTGIRHDTVTAAGVSMQSMQCDGAHLP